MSSTPTLSMESALQKCAIVSTKLGLGLSADFDRLRGFLDGPFVLAVSGMPRTGRSRVREALTNLRCEMIVNELDLNSAGSLALWDLLVLVTPADRALSKIEEEVIRSARATGRPVAVVVSRADLLGNGDARLRSEAEIRKLRLEPALRPLGVQAFFSGLGEPLTAAFRHLEALLPSEPREAHKPIALWELVRILNAGAAQLGDRVRVREKELGHLQAVESELPLILAHLAEVRALARLTVRDEQRSQDERLLKAAKDSVIAAVRWTERVGVGDWADVERPLRETWGALIKNAPRTCEVGLASVQAELNRLAERSNQAIIDLRVSQPHILPVDSSLSSEELLEAVAALSVSDITPLLSRLKTQAQKELKRVQKLDVGQHKEESKEVGGSTSEPSLGQQVLTSLQNTADKIVQLASSSFETRAMAQVTADLEAISGPKLERLSRLATEATDMSTKDAIDAFSETLRSQVRALRDSLQERHDWGEAYGDLLTLQAWAEEALAIRGD